MRRATRLEISSPCYESGLRHRLQQLQDASTNASGTCLNHPMGGLSTATTNRQGRASAPIVAPLNPPTTYTYVHKL